MSLAAPPYNEHLIHDAGAFQLGIGVAVLAALWWPDGLVAALPRSAGPRATGPTRTWPPCGRPSSRPSAPGLSAYREGIQAMTTREVPWRSHGRSRAGTRPA
jgi:hypothetical protein